MATTGKSTIGKELARQGHDVIDADQFAYFGNLASGEQITYPAVVTSEWLADNGWMWERNKRRRLLTEPQARPRFVCGGARNQHEFYEYFDSIFLLHIPDELLLSRLAVRNQPHTNNRVVIDRMLREVHNVYDLAQKIGAKVIEADQPAELSVGQILEHIQPSQTVPSK